MNKYILGLIIAGVCFAVLFLSYPEIDLYITHLFYNEEEGFYLDERYGVFSIIHDSVRSITIITAVICFVLLGLNFALKKEILGFDKKKLAFVILALIIGPGLIVNSLFKDNWGRARPHQTVEFGGTKEFTPPFIIAGQCERNCSFVSGDPSVGFFFVSFALIFANRRREILFFALSLGSVLGATRVVQGAHFTSDVIFSCILTILTCYFLHKFMFRKKS